jgi:hypothetical protein
MATEETRISERGDRYRYLQPSRLLETYLRIGDQRQIAVIRRRGFGQYALSEEFADGSIGVFMHRGDGEGEGGSNVYFLANMPAKYEPLSNLFDKLSRKLANRALIVSDGSNCRIERLRKRDWQREVRGPEAFRESRPSAFTFGGWSWECVGYLGERYGPTLVWGVTRLEK